MNSHLPKLSYIDGKETYETLQLWTQIIGKIKLVKLPWINHFWHVTLFVTPRGLTTLTIPDQNQYYQIDFDFIQHTLKIITDSGEMRQLELKAISVAQFYKNVFDALAELKIDAAINALPNEVEEAIPFYKDNIHSAYNPEQARAFHKALLYAQDIFTRFRAEFQGKCSPVHFFWGSFDLAVTRFSGRTAPKHPGGVPNLPDSVAQEAYTQEVSSCGFWPGSETVPFAAFYSYAYPEPEGFKMAKALPDGAYYHEEVKEFILPYEVVRQSKDPEKTLLDFLHSTYNAAAELAQWDRESLEEQHKNKTNDKKDK